MQTIRRDLEPHGSVTAAVVFDALMTEHELWYARGRWRGLRLAARLNAPLGNPITKWLSDIRALFDPDLVPLLSGRQVILGLAMLDLALAGELWADGFLEAVKEEVAAYAFSEEGQQERVRIRERPLAGADFERRAV